MMEKGLKYMKMHEGGVSFLLNPYCGCVFFITCTKLYIQVNLIMFDFLYEVEVYLHRTKFKSSV